MVDVLAVVGILVIKEWSLINISCGGRPKCSSRLERDCQRNWVKALGRRERPVGDVGGSRDRFMSNVRRTSLAGFRVGYSTREKSEYLMKCDQNR